MKTEQQAGTDFQTAVQDELSVLQTQRGFVYHRLYDTRSAGAYLPAQPGDFCGTIQRRGFLIEVKSSLKHSSLADNRAALNDLFSDDQVAKMRLWAMAGAITFVVFLDQGSGKREIWDGEYVAKTYVTPRARLNANRCWRTEGTTLLQDLKAYFTHRLERL